MSFALPESMRSYIDERVRGGEYGNTSEYLRDLIRRDQQAEEARRFRMLIVDGLESGEGRPLTSEVVDELRARARRGSERWSASTACGPVGWDAFRAAGSTSNAAIT